jgi:ribonucleotide reductase alpha subunit
MGYDWETLRKDIKQYGVTNSLISAIMPTASSAKATNSYEMTEPIHSNLFTRRVLGGEFIIPNKYLMEDLEKLGIWSDRIKDELLIHDGSIQKINFNKYLNTDDKNYDKKVSRVEFLLKKYRTIYEIPQKSIIDMAIDRAPFIDQSQSMNIHMAEPTISKMTSSQIYAWENGLKTLSYYFRTKAISTGAKHLGTDISKINDDLPPKPKDSQFDCFGCSS